MVNLYRMRQLMRYTIKARWKVEKEMARATKITSVLTGMPHGGGVHDKLGEGVPDLVDKKRELEEIRRGYEQEEARLNGWIDRIEDLQIQLIFSLRFKERMSWNEVADTVGGNNSEDSVRMTVNRYLEKGEKADAEGS